MALSANKLLSYVPGGITKKFKLSNVKVYRGSLVSVNSAGYIVAATDLASSVFAGVSLDEVDNSAGSAGDKEVEVDIGGAMLEVTHSDGSMAQTNVSDAVVANGDAAVVSAATATNDIPVGVIAEVVSATKVIVKCRAFGVAS